MHFGFNWRGDLTKTAVCKYNDRQEHTHRSPNKLTINKVIGKEIEMFMGKLSNLFQFKFFMFQDIIKSIWFLPGSIIVPNLTSCEQKTTDSIVPLDFFLIEKLYMKKKNRLACNLSYRIPFIGLPHGCGGI